jgi:hypothetical protein
MLEIRVVPGDLLGPTLEQVFALCERAYLQEFADGGWSDRQSLRDGTPKRQSLESNHVVERAKSPVVHIRRANRDVAQPSTILLMPLAVGASVAPELHPATITTTSELRIQNDTRRLSISMAPGRST